MKFRRKYYNLFSKFYDKFIQVHSGDKQEKIREYFVDLTGMDNNSKVLDICCGTGSTLKYIKQKVNSEKGICIGIDFSDGMLEKAKEKIPEAWFLLCSVAEMPIKNHIFDVVTCTFAFYELKGELVDRTLLEIKRVLKKNGKFFMMEHEIPEKFIIRMLFYIRMFSMGFKKGMNILKNEEKIFRKYFKNVEKKHSVSKNSKIWVCYD